MHSDSIELLYTAAFRYSIVPFKYEPRVMYTQSLVFEVPMIFAHFYTYTWFQYGFEFFVVIRAV